MVTGAAVPVVVPFCVEVVPMVVLVVPVLPAGACANATALASANASVTKLFFMMIASSWVSYGPRAKISGALQGLVARTLASGGVPLWDAKD